MIKWTSQNRQQQSICWEFWFNGTFLPKLACPWDHHPSKPLEVDKLRKGLSFSVPFRKLHVSNVKKPCLIQTQVWEDFHWFQLTVQIRAWGLMHFKEKMCWVRPKTPGQELFCLREFDVSSDPRSAPQTTKSHFSWRVTWQGDSQVLSLKRHPY